MRVASGDQRPRYWLRSGDSLQPEAPPERRRVASQAPALSPQQPPRQRAGCALFLHAALAKERTARPAPAPAFPAPAQSPQSRGTAQNKGGKPRGVGAPRSLL